MDFLNLYWDLDKLRTFFNSPAKVLILLRKGRNSRYRLKGITAIIMIFRYLKLLIPTFLAVLALIGLLPMNAHALSIGKLAVKSAYGQALKAEISIPAYSANELETLTISLGSQLEFEQAGLSWLPWFSQLTMALRYNANGQPFIILHTPAPVNELTLSLIVEFSWKGGRTAKQFDSLLSPSLPTLPSTMSKSKEDSDLLAGSTSPAEPQDVKSGTPIEQEYTQIQKRKGVTKQQRQNPRRPKSELKDLGNGEISYGPVLPGQTLSSIAEKLSSRTHLNLQQRMQVLFDLNPEAFTRNSFGSLKAGYTLMFSTDAIPDDRPMIDENVSHLENETQSSNRKPVQALKSPVYEDNVDSITQIGQIVRRQDDAEVSDEAQTLKLRLQETRINVEAYRKTNDDLRARLVELETQLKSQADQLGIIEPEPITSPVNTSLTPQTTSSLNLQ